ncbi:MAG: MSHA fimbrial biogenesis protein MshG [Candidatus Pelagadaptatus aseana]|uniref:type II secretion system F family protein n=1 Tax=Candidatus Pelagadaptatus aseana TaxID=3120508 RepID=UPI0039B16243
MANFQYQGRDAEGKSVAGMLEGSSSDAVASQLMGRGITPVSIAPAKAGSVEIDFKSLLGPEKVRPEDLIMLTRQFYTITKAGIPLIRGVRGLAASISHQRLKEVLMDIGDYLETGMQLSAAMNRHQDIFDTLYINMIKVGEDSGQLEAIFDQLSEYLERDMESRKRVKAAMRYPSFVLAALAVAMVVVNIFVIPAFAKMFSQFGADLPLATRILIGTSNFFLNYWGYLLGITVAAMVAFRRYIKTADGSQWWGKYKLKLPIVGDILLRALMARYARSFGLMLKSGVPLPQSLELCSRAIGNDYLGHKIADIKHGVERGESLLRTHNQSGLFTPLVLQMIAVGEESGQVDTLLAEVAGFYEREVDYDLKTLSDRIEPIMIVIMAIFVLILALGIFLPMWSMYDVQAA